MIAMDTDRKNFWLRYLDSIEYSRVIFGRQALEIGIKETEIRNFILQRRHAQLERCDRKISAFILKIKDAVIVEFSRKGNACYFYSKHNLPFEMDARSYKIHELKDTAEYYGTKHYHRPGWEDKFEQYLKTTFKIIPKGVYYW